MHLDRGVSCLFHFHFGLEFGSCSSVHGRHIGFSLGWYRRVSGELTFDGVRAVYLYPWLGFRLFISFLLPF